MEPDLTWVQFYAMILKKGVVPMTHKAKKQLEYTLATNAIERLSPSQKAIQLCKQMSEGKLDADSAVVSLLSQYGLLGASNK